jgi:hypothetical protein
MTEAPTPKLNLRKLEKIQRRLQYGAVLVLVVFIALILFSWFQLRGINKEIEEKKSTLERVSGELKDKEKELESKKTEYAELENKFRALQVKTRALSATVGFNDNPEDAKGVEQIIEQANGNKAQLPPRIYISIHDGQQKRAGEIASQLQARGYVVPRINVGNYAPRVSELRYYQPGASPDDVNDLSNFLSSKGIKFIVPKPSTSDRVRPRHYEIAFSDDF